ncbi:hypothetical protein VTK26DRAFT_8958 [Humicola hyalothermophila]
MLQIQQDSSIALDPTTELSLIAWPFKTRDIRSIVRQQAELARDWDPRFLQLGWVRHRPKHARVNEFAPVEQPPR